MTKDLNLLNISNINELNSYLKELEKKELVIEDDLKGISDSMTALTLQFDNCLISFPKTHQTEVPRKKMQSLLHHATSLSIGISAKVRKLDSAKQKVQQTISIIDELFIFRDCAEELSTSITNHDYEKSAILISKYLSLNSTVKELATIIYSDLNMDQENFTQLCNIFMNDLKSHIEKALRLQDTPTVIQSSLYFSMIQFEDLGVQYISTHLSQLAKNKLLDLVIKIEGLNVKSATEHSSVIVNILETFAAIIKEYEPQILKQYSEKHFSTVILNLLKECEYLFLRSTQAMLRFIKIESLVLQCKSFLESSSSENSQNRSESLSNEIPHLIQIFSLLNVHGSLFLRFLIRRTNSEPTAKILILESNISKIMDTMMDHYLLFEQYLLTEFINMALSSDEIDLDAKTYRMLDDIIFLVKKTVCRALTSGSSKSICSILNIVTQLITDRIIHGRLQNKINIGLPANWLKYASSTRLTSLSQHAAISLGQNILKQQQKFLFTMNTIAVLASSIEKLYKELLIDLTNFEKNFLLEHFQNIASALNEFNSKLLCECNELLTKGFNEISKNSIKEAIRTNIEPFKTGVSVITETDLENFSVNDPWVCQSLSNIDGVIIPFRTLLIASNYQRFINMFISEFTNQFEKCILQKVFSKCGAMQLDIELRSIMAYFTKIDNWTVRDKMARISQICSLINVESLDDVVFYWDSQNWSLPPNDIRLVLQLRTEFAASDIKKLKF